MLKVFLDSSQPQTKPGPSVICLRSICYPENYFKKTVSFEQRACVYLGYFCILSA